MNVVIKRPCPPIESLRQACIEMNLIREGRLAPKRDWRAMFSELEDELKKEDISDDNAR